MIDPEIFVNTLLDLEIEFFTGVPDSLLKDFSGYVFDHINPDNHIIAANEGAAIALATGVYLATGKPALVYMQNSGIGNSINPLLSLADPEVYGIPMILMIGWRGMPGVRDEPQHIKQGRVQNALLDAMEIPYLTIGPDISDFYNSVRNLLERALIRNGPVALVVQKDTFSHYYPEPDNRYQKKNLMSREYALTKIIETLNCDEIVVSTTGMTSREVFEIRKKSNSSYCRDFLTVGSMGHCSQIALGIALKAPKRPVFCLDGDGAFIMHMGSVAVIGQTRPANLKHIVLNNGVHDSVGGQPTAASVINLSKIALSCGYNGARTADNEPDLIKSLSWIKHEIGPVFLEVIIRPGARKELGRPTRTPLENRLDFESYIRGN